MKNLTLFAFVVSSALNCSAQVMFEIESPVSLRGVYPCMEPSNANWNIPDLSAVGNWFSDTIVPANDGTTGSACGTLTSQHQGKIAIFYRDTCLMGHQLLNVQNQGATGALVIDSVAGRPLSFGSDLYSNQVNIPFVIISKDEGIAILNALNSGETVIANFGNKQGQNAVDLGIYMDHALWSSFAYYPWSNSAGIFPDTTFGVWLYNNGQQDVSDVTVEFWGDAGQDSFSYFSDSIHLFPGDSAYVPFHVTPSFLNFSNSCDYGYRIHGTWADADTLDNSIRSKYFNSDYYHDIISRTFLDENNPEDTEADFFLLSPQVSESHFGFRMKSENIICWKTLNFRTKCEEHTELYAHLSPLTNWSAVPFLEQVPPADFSAGWFDYPGDLWMSFFWSSGFGLYEHDTTAMFITHYTNPFPYHIGFTTDMYHDERRRQEPFHEVYLSVDASVQNSIDPKLTELFYLEASTSPHDCGWGIGENKEVSFQINPNPAVNSFEVKTEHKFDAVRMFSLSGKQIDLIRIEAFKYQFSAEPGIYLVQIVNENGKSSSRKLIVSE